ncbi:MAG TPA: hypothetical protein VFL83_03105 [Anaeromyxobacter sp.]|nr:hypothetical protein [Anaeromyxobacter sp.]
MGALAIRSLAIKTARIHRLEIDELIVAHERFPASRSGSAEPSPAI